jgi:hypothetical protein
MGGRQFMWVLLVALLACVAPHINDEGAARLLIPIVPGQVRRPLRTFWRPF